MEPRGEGHSGRKSENSRREEKAKRGRAAD
jgi:hypothetical protein